MSLDLSDHIIVFGIGKELFLGIHCKYTAPFVTVFIFGYHMYMQMTQGITVSAVINLIGLKGGMQGLGYMSHISHKGIPLIIRNIDYFIYMILVSNDTPSRVALFLKKYKLACVKVADLDSEIGECFPTCTVGAIIVFH